MSWDQLRRRNQVVNAVLTEVARTGQPDIPADLQHAVDTEFGGLGGLLRDVQGRWYRSFDARLDAVLESWPENMPAALARLENEVNEVMPAARRLLDGNGSHPDLAEIRERHERMTRAAIGPWAELERLPAAC